MNSYKQNVTLTARERRTYRERLLKLAEHLKSLPKGHYKHERFITAYDPKNKCGTVACAYGHAVASGKFRGIPDRIEADTYGGWNIETGDWMRDPSDTAEAYFGPGSFELIFSGVSFGLRNPTPTMGQVIKRIEKVATSVFA